MLLDQLSKHIQSVAIRAVHVHSKSCLKRQSMHTSKFCLLGYQCILNILPKDTVHDYFKCCLSKRAVQTCLKCYLKGSPIIIKWCLKGSWFIQYFKCCLKGIPFVFKLLPKGAISAKKLSMFFSSQIYDSSCSSRKLFRLKPRVN